MIQILLMYLSFQKTDDDERHSDPLVFLPHSECNNSTFIVNKFLALHV